MQVLCVPDEVPLYLVPLWSNHCAIAIYCAIDVKCSTSLLPLQPDVKEGHSYVVDDEGNDV